MILTPLQLWAQQALMDALHSYKESIEKFVREETQEKMHVQITNVKLSVRPSLFDPESVIVGVSLEAE